jgi:hypothetical protein
VGEGVTFFLRFAVLQVIFATGVFIAYLAGLANLPFIGTSAPFCIAVAVVFAVGMGCVLLKRWDDAQWISQNILFLGLLGTVIGLIIAFSPLRTVSSDPEAIRAAISHVIDGMFVALFVTVFGITSRLWLKLNLRLLAGEM